MVTKGTFAILVFKKYIWIQQYMFIFVTLKQVDTQIHNIDGEGV
jgi:hypothetical protein